MSRLDSTINQSKWPRLLIRLPPDMKRWLENESRRNASAQASEVVRCIRDRMERKGAADKAS